jgi:hypothetical protein
VKEDKEGFFVFQRDVLVGAACVHGAKSPARVAIFPQQPYFDLHGDMV